MRSAVAAAVGAMLCMACTADAAYAQNSGRSEPAVESQLYGPYKRPRIDSPLPDGKVARGSRNILAAWFSDPTPRYRHFVLGSEHEASALVVSTSDRRVYRLTLAADSVFEDREPRIVDVDGDGNDEVIVVRSYIKSGAALAVAAVRGHALEIVAETPPIGMPFRWLNPAGVADFDGDGRPDIALVRMPHSAGELRILTLRDGKLVEIQAVDDVSNHALGSRHLQLSAIADFDGDGVADLAIPSRTRHELRFLSFKGGRLREIGRAALPAAASEDFSVVTKDGRKAVRVGFSSGRSILVAP
ncbi:MAG TPA: VCBS repeat-containing protein [Hyphomicrobiaceae bacterium]|nr:VCBS repeat-containing protein [Hyphomicrobiaceae bacterium]